MVRVVFLACLHVAAATIDLDRHVTFRDSADSHKHDQRLIENHRKEDRDATLSDRVIKVQDVAVGSHERESHAHEREVDSHDRAVGSHSRSVLELGFELSADEREVLISAAGSLISLEQDSPEIGQVLKAVSGKMDRKSAFTVVESKKIPADVASLIKVKAADGEGPGFSEESIEKARLVLNGMVEKSWKELDDKIIECKEFEEQNRGTYGQVTTDISRLVAQISDLSRTASEAIEGGSDKEGAITEAEATLAEETRTYNQIWAENQAELAIRQNDLDVFQFILQFTRCEGVTSLVQMPRVCQTSAGESVLHFDDKELQERFEKKLTNHSQRMVSDVLRDVQMEHQKRMALLGQPISVFSSTPSPQKKVPVLGEEAHPCASNGDPSQCMKSCPPIPPDCGLLHDKLSLMWGDYKDKVDSLQMEISKNEMEFQEFKANMNAEITLLTTSKARFAALLSESRSNLAGDREEKKAKEKARIDLEREYSEFTQACKKRISWIMYQDMCAIIVVRNAVLEDSTVCPSEAITDCELDNWVLAECSMSCDDTCPPTHNNPYGCGGWQTMSRDVVVPPDTCGLKCPALSRKKKCNQIKCPQNCVMSSWSGWSKCTADCEGGVQGHTRSVLVKPKNGGAYCNTVEESRACNTGSCDRDCRLTKWTSWKPCSVACGGGFQERFRHVLIPTRGFGKCPKSSSPKRYEKQICNDHVCNGDEICLAQQDLVLAIDGSGSMTESGFEILKKFASKLVTRYTGKYYGSPSMRVGVVQFGNGVIMPDAVSISPAMNIQPLTDRLDIVSRRIDAMSFKKGFTNMAQAFALAEKLYIAKGRANVQSSIIVITDGRPSFIFQTNELVQQLDDKNIQRYFVVVADSTGPLEQMKTWASSPWETNLIRIGGLEILEADLGVWVQKVVTLFCPLAISPAVQVVQENVTGLMKVKASGFCGSKGKVLSTQVPDAQACAELAESVGSSAFLLGTWFRKGHCISSKMTVDEAQFEAWQRDRFNPGCPERWTESKIFDFYAIKVHPKAFQR